MKFAMEDNSDVEDTDEKILREVKPREDNSYVEDTDEIVLTEVKPRRWRSRCCRCLFWCLSVIACAIALCVGYFYLESQQFEIPLDVARSIGDHGLQTFTSYDRNGDGYLSLKEFEALYLHMLGTGVNITEDPEIYQQPIAQGDGLVTVKSSFQPLLLDSMTRESEPDWVEPLDVLAGLKKWKTSNIPWMNFGVKYFMSFSPPTEQYIHQVGSVYWLLEDKESLMDKIRGDISSNRFYPPYVEERIVIVHRLLSMLHPRPFVTTRFKPRGMIACVRAYNDEYMDIVFRLHAEFQLNEPPYQPFWFTPGQFTGNLVIARESSSILHFHMAVPTGNKLNVDMEWLEGEDSMVVDIGYMPEMSLSITAPSIVPKNDFEYDVPLPETPSNVDKIVWTKEISYEEASRNLEVQMYPFKVVPYYNLTESLNVAKREDKLVHSIVLWGVLDDQSC